MVEFETVKSDEIKFGNNNFIEVARKKAIDGENVNEFVSLTRGFFGNNGEKRYKKNFSIPLTENVAEFVVKKIKEMAKGAPASSASSDESDNE